MGPIPLEMGDLTWVLIIFLTLFYAPIFVRLDNSCTTLLTKHPLNILNAFPSFRKLCVIDLYSTGLIGSIPTSFSFLSLLEGKILFVMCPAFLFVCIPLQFSCLFLVTWNVWLCLVIWSLHHVLFWIKKKLCY